MSKQKLFDDDSDEEVAIKTQNEYAKKYDAWREREEKHKLEQKYGVNPDPNVSLSSDSEDESDEPPEVSEEMETQFLKTLALLKTKDPRIYDPEFKFFNEKDNVTEKSSEKEEKPKTLTFADSDDDDDDDPNIFTIEKKAEIDNEEPGPKEKTKKSKATPKDGKLKDFMTGKADHLEDEVEKELEPLKAFWSDPKLNEGEAFLRDYILNKRYLEEGPAGDVAQVRDDEELEADEQLVEEQGKFERAYNFRFEEPDDEYLKRYPRTMNFIRPKDDARARRRSELRARKAEEKRRQLDELARLRALKLKEIREKIARLKEVTGNQELAFKDEDIEGDFDPEEHDRRMAAIFNEQYYDGTDERKPEFPQLDEELEIENWEKYEQEEFREATADDTEEGPHCEDEDFNMDADYDPKKSRETLMEELKRNMGTKRRNRKRKSKLGELLAMEKPKFVPELESTYAQFMEEYYRMDCEDVVGGDLPTRFKYRQVVPNDYGLSIEEILLADDKELTQWVPLKRLVRLRPERDQRSEVGSYRARAADRGLKRKVLPSLFKDLPEEPEIVVPVDNGKKKKKKKKRKDNSESNTTGEDMEQEIVSEVNRIEDVAETPMKKKKKHKENDGNIEVNEQENSTEDKVKRKKKNQKTYENDVSVEEQANKVEERINRKKKDKISDPSNDVTENIVDGSKEVIQDPNVDNDIESHNEVIENNKQENKKDKKKKKENSFVVENIGNVEPSQASHGTEPKIRKRAHSESQKGPTQNNGTPAKKKKKQKNSGDKQQNSNKKINKFKQNKFKHKQENNNANPLGGLSDERLKAYGLNPKKYRGFLKYKKF